MQRRRGDQRAQVRDPARPALTHPTARRFNLASLAHVWSAMGPQRTNGGARSGVGRLLPVFLPLLVTTPVAPPASPAIAIVDVRLLPMDGGGAREHQSVLIEGERIAWVGPADALPAPPGTLVIHGEGRTLMPGLVDMHVHLNREDLRSYLAYGVTTVRNMWGFPDVWAMKREIEGGEIAGPTIFSVSPGLDGTPPKWPLTQLVMDPAAADSVVAEQWRAGYRTLKIYQDLRPEAYDAIVAAARSRGMDLVGHVPHRVGLEHALGSGQRSVEHLTGFVEELSLDGGRGPEAWVRIRPDGIAALTTAAHEAGTWVCPTLAIVARMGRRLPPADRESFLANRRMVVLALHAEGVGLLIGSDAGIDVVDPGSSLLDEIEEFVAAGIPPIDALRIATAGAAEFLGQGEEFGVVVAGARADLLLLDGDPARDIAALEAPAGVMVRGRWFLEPGATGGEPHPPSSRATRSRVS
jgi:imidazolonepropionase-like amidohydrolase